MWAFRDAAPRQAQGNDQQHVAHGMKGGVAMATHLESFPELLFRECPRVPVPDLVCVKKAGERSATGHQR